MRKILITIDLDDAQVILLMAKRFQKFSVHMMEHRLAKSTGGGRLTVNVLNKMAVAIKEFEEAIEGSATTSSPPLEDAPDNFDPFDSVPL